MNPYRKIFVDFSRAELATGGPDPQVTLVGRAMALRRDDLSPEERALRCGLFVVPYTIGAGAVLMHLRDVGYPREHWGSFLIQHKEGFPMRRERRAVWGDDRAKLLRCIDSYAFWVVNTLPNIYKSPYEDVYASINKECAFFGRYAAMKVIETLWHAGLVTNAQDSIVAKGAKYPRKMLALMFPDYAEQMNSKSNDPQIIANANAMAGVAGGWIGQPVTWFQLETLLCNSRQSLSGKYAGRSHDRELAHWRRASGYFREHGIDLRQTFPFYQMRSHQFDAQYLGEKGDPQWWGARDDLERAQLEEVRNVLQGADALV